MFHGCCCCDDVVPQCSDPEGPESFRFTWDGETHLEYDVEQVLVGCELQASRTGMTRRGLENWLEVNPTDDHWTALQICWLKDGGVDLTTDPDTTRGYAAMFQNDHIMRRIIGSDVRFADANQWVADTELDDRPWRPVSGYCWEWESPHTARETFARDNVFFFVYQFGFDRCERRGDVGFQMWLSEDGIFRATGHPPTKLPGNLLTDADGRTKIYAFPDRGLWDDREPITRFGTFFGMTAPKPDWINPEFPGQNRAFEDIGTRARETEAKGGIYHSKICVGVDYVERCPAWFLGRETVTLTFSAEWDPNPPAGHMQFWEPLELRGVSATLERNFVTIDKFLHNGNQTLKYHDTAYTGSITFPVTRVIEPDLDPAAIGNDQLTSGTRIDIVYVPCQWIRLQFTGGDCDACDEPTEVWLRASDHRRGPSWDLNGEPSYEPVAIGYRKRVVNNDPELIEPGESARAGCPPCDHHCPLKALETCGYTFTREVAQIAGAFQAVAAHFYVDITA